MGNNDAREMLEVAKAEAVRLEADLEAVTDDYQLAHDDWVRLAADHKALRAERDQIARLHEEATERTVQLSAVIEQARTELETSGTPAPRTDAPIRVLRAQETLATADTDAALREVRARAWEDGSDSALGRWDGAVGFDPSRNPYREGVDRG